MSFEWLCVVSFSTFEDSGHDCPKSFGPPATGGVLGHSYSPLSENPASPRHLPLAGDPALPHKIIPVQRKMCRGVLCGWMRFLVEALIWKSSKLSPWMYCHHPNSNQIRDARRSVARASNRRIFAGCNAKVTDTMDLQSRQSGHPLVLSLRAVSFDIPRDVHLHGIDSSLLCTENNGMFELRTAGASVLGMHKLTRATVILEETPLQHVMACSAHTSESLKFTNKS
jgi:hypothetical protein